MTTHNSHPKEQKPRSLQRLRDIGNGLGAVVSKRVRIEIEPAKPSTPKLGSLSETMTRKIEVGSSRKLFNIQNAVRDLGEVNGNNSYFGNINNVPMISFRDGQGGRRDLSALVFAGSSAVAIGGDFDSNGTLTKSWATRLPYGHGKNDRGEGHKNMIERPVVAVLDAKNGQRQAAEFMVGSSTLGDDEYASRQHCKLRLGADGRVGVDNVSKNGTTVLDMASLERGMLTGEVAEYAEEMLVDLQNYPALWVPELAKKQA